MTKSSRRTKGKPEASDNAPAPIDIQTIELDFNVQPKQHEVWQILDAPGRPVTIGYGGSRGGAKQSPLDSRVLTPKGWKLMGDLKVGDLVSDPTTGGHTRVIAIHPHPNTQAYRVTCDDGASLEVGIDHLWAYKLANHIRPGTKKRKTETELSIMPDGSRWSKLRVGDTKELMDELKKGHGVRIPLTEPVQFTVNGRTGTGSIDPYLIGLFLGDGHLPTKTITNADPEIIDYLVKLGFSHRHYPPKAPSLCPTGKLAKRLAYWFSDNGLSKARSWEKFVPQWVFTAPLAYRHALLQGLMDSDGTIGKGGKASFTSVSHQLAKDVQELIWSLGGKATMRSRENHYVLKGEHIPARTCYTLYIRMRKNSSLFRLSRKKARSLDRWNGGHELMREIVSIEPSRVTDCACITVSSPFGLYVAEDYIVTHNSHLGRAWVLASVLKYDNAIGWVIRKTLDDIRDNHITPMLREYPWMAHYYHKQEKTVYLPGNRQIRFISAEHAGDLYRLAGKEAAFILVDQAEQFTQEELEWVATLNRCTTNLAITPKMLWTFNPGGVGHQYLKRIFISKQYDNNEVPEDYAFVQAFGWDNIEWVRRYLTVEGIPFEDYYNKWTDEERFQAFIRHSDYGKRLYALPDSQRQALLFGDFDVFEGQFFSEFRHKYHVTVKPIRTIPEGATVSASIDYGKRTEMIIGFREAGSGRITFLDECWTTHGSPAERAERCVQLLERWGRWNDEHTQFSLARMPLLYDTNMKASSENYHGSQYSILSYFEEVFKRHFGDQGPIFLPVAKKKGEDNRKYRQICNEAFREHLAWSVDKDGKLVRPPLMLISSACKMLVNTVPELQYPEHDLSDGLDFDQGIGIDDPFDAAKYLLMFLRTPYINAQELPIRSEAEYMERVVFAELYKRQRRIGHGSYADSL